MINLLLLTRRLVTLHLALLPRKFFKVEFFLEFQLFILFIYCAQNLAAGIDVRGILRMRRHVKDIVVAHFAG